MITTYVINLEKERERKMYMENLLKPYTFLNVEFINAVNGNELSEEEISNVFDEDLAYKRYGRKLNRGEIGCTLSHYKCYKKLLDSTNHFALILEDDITIIRDLYYIKEIYKYMDTSEPCVLFLSADYWWKVNIDKSNSFSIRSVFDACGTYAYLINKAAAKFILDKNKKASCVADNWSLYRYQGLKLKAIFPYMIDANIESFESTINQSYFGENRKNMPFVFRLKAYWNALIKKILLKQGKFVSKIRERKNTTL